MKITGGVACGRSINIPAHPSVRPTGAKMREALFNILGKRVVNADFLDLFAGSGLMGFEALSRGAKSLTSVENNKICLRCIEANANKLGYKENMKIVPFDFRKALLNLAGKQFDIIFADPPYKADYIAQIIQLIAKDNLLKAGGILVIEHDKAKTIQSNYICSEDIPGLRLLESRSYGQSAFSFFT